MSRVNLKSTANLLHLNTPSTQNTDYYLKKLPQESNNNYVDLLLKTS